MEDKLQSDSNNTGRKRKKYKRAKPMQSQFEQAVLDVYDFCKKEYEAGVPIVPLSHIARRVTKMLRVADACVKRVLRKRQNGIPISDEDDDFDDDSQNNKSHPVNDISIVQDVPSQKVKRVRCSCPNCVENDTNMSAGGERKKQHICHIAGCNKSYIKTSHLKAHLRWHSGDMPYVCSWEKCSKRFTRSDELKRHKMTHIRVKKFRCPECFKKFLRKDHLSQHKKRRHEKYKIKEEPLSPNSMSAEDSSSEENKMMINDLNEEEDPDLASNSDNT